MNLSPCPSCARHVHARETTCPFCYAALDPSRAGSSRALTTTRLSRAALVALGTALSACGHDETPAQKMDEPRPIDLPPAAVYGGPPPRPGEDAAVQQPSGLTDAAPPIPTDAGAPPTVPDAGFLGKRPRPPAPVYGGPPPSTR